MGCSCILIMLFYLKHEVRRAGVERRVFSGGSAKRPEVIFLTEGGVMSKERIKFLHRAMLFVGLAICLFPRVVRAEHGVAGTLTANPRTPCIGGSVRVLGAGDWRAIPERCFYRFLFDNTGVAMQGPDVGITEQPDRTFPIPTTAQPGEHKITVELLRESDTSVHARKSITITVVEVKCSGFTVCSSLDSGFDRTTDPPWLSVAVGQTTKVATATITPGDKAGNVFFKSTVPGTATVSPRQGQLSLTFLEVTGVAKGEAEIEATTSGASLQDPPSVCKRLNVAVYPKPRVVVAAHIITPKRRPGHPPDGCPATNPNTTASQLQDALNKIWDQAAIEFTVILDSVEVDFDSNDSCVLDQIIFGSPGLGPERQAIVDAVKDPDARINVYYVHDYQLAPATTTISMRLTFISDSRPNTTENITAHEIGHSLGLSDVATATSLMYLLSDAGNPCLLSKSEWDTSNVVARAITQ